MTHEGAVIEVEEGMSLEKLLEIVRAIPDPSIGDIGRLLFVQGTVMHHVGMEVLKSSNGVARRMTAAVNILNGAEKALARSAEYLQETGLTAERVALLDEAYKKGYDIAFEVDGRITLECSDRRGLRMLLDSV